MLNVRALWFSSAWMRFLLRALPSCSCFLCCDWLWLAAGSESGRSSPYYGQDGRSSTPTTIQPPKHFHVPGRTPHLRIALFITSSFFFLFFFNPAGKISSAIIHYWKSFRKVILSSVGMTGCENVTKSYFYAARNCSGIFFPPSYCTVTLFYLPLQPPPPIIPTETHILSSFTPPCFTSSSPLSLLSHRGPQHLQEASHLSESGYSAVSLALACLSSCQFSHAVLEYSIVDVFTDLLMFFQRSPLWFIGIDIPVIIENWCHQ